MVIAFDGQVYNDEVEYTKASLNSKELSDRWEMAGNETSGDFQSRFNAVDTAPRMVPEATEKLTDAFKSSGGMVTPGNIDLTKRPVVKNEDGSISTVRSMSANFDGKEVLIPTVAHDGSRILSNDEAIQQYKDTGLHLGEFTTPEAATSYADKLHKDQEAMYSQPRSVVAKLTGSDGGERFQTWPERLVRSAFTLPGDVLSGKVEPGSIQEIERAADLAGLVVLGPAPVAAKMADGSLGSFAGVKSKTLPKDKLYEAQNKELEMVHPDTIWQETGFFRGADSRWRYEIPDKDAKLKLDAFDQIDNINHPDYGGERVTTVIPKAPERSTLGSGNMIFPGPKKSLMLDQVIDHPELFKAYPELKTMKVEPLPSYLKEANVHGQVVGDTIYLAEGHPEYLRSVLLHEIQHGIQRHEGFAFGGNTEQFLSKELPKAEKEFLQVKKEIEPKITEKLGVPHSDILFYKQAVQMEQLGMELSPAYQTLVDRLKEKGQYQRVSNILESERLLQQAKQEAFTKYRSLMGEVEARNVQTRINYDTMRRQFETPMKTEDVHRMNQINPK